MVHRHRTQRRRRTQRRTRRQHGGNHNSFIKNLQIFTELEDKLREGNDIDRRAVYKELIDFLIKNDQFTKSIYLSKRLKMKIAEVLVKEIPNLPEQTLSGIQILKQHFGL